MNTNFKDLYDFNLVQAPVLRKTAQPLKDNFGIDFLSYRRFCKNGNLIYLINNQEWMGFSFEKGWINSESFHKRLSLLSYNGFLNYVWPCIPSSKDSIYCALHSLNIRNGIALYKTQDDCIEVFAFSSTNSPELTHDLYLNNLFILDRFILYFREKVAYIAKNITNECLLKHDIFDYHLDFKNDFLEKYCEQTKYKHFCLRINSREVSLSIKETKCLDLLSQGKPIKEVARMLKISPRTVETHINNAKIKTDICSTLRLVDVFFKEKRKYQL